MGGGLVRIDRGVQLEGGEGWLEGANDHQGAVAQGLEPRVVGLPPKAHLGRHQSLGGAAGRQQGLGLV